MLYTRKGDKGDTYFFGSKDRFSKGSLKAEALGALDEINSLLGVCRAKAREIPIDITVNEEKQQIADIIESVEQDLFIIQAALAGAPKKITKEKIVFLEKIIDSIEKELPPINTFFLSGGTELSSILDYARAIARRAERRVVLFSESKEIEITPEILSYLNRLSSLLYALARIVNLKSGVKEIPPSYRE